MKEKASQLSDAVIDEIARALLPNILDYFASDRGKREFEEWKKKKSEVTKAETTKESDKAKSEA
ncbi:MAG: hypothetical protein IJQ37_07075 [Clostridia bacterium]|nr:hypothetical protein [Clostridia bacterium]